MDRSTKLDQSKKVVVTGGAGFIGSHLVEELVKRNHNVVIIDNLSTGKMENIKHLLDMQNLQFTKGDVMELPLLQELFKETDYIFHEAALTTVPRSIENPRASHDVNATGTLNVLIAAKDNGVKKVIYASSSSVYGDTPTLPKTENMMPQPKSPYAVSKLTGEYYCQVFQQVYGLKTVVLRYFNVYGPRQDPERKHAAVIPKFIKAALNGEPLIIFGDGEQTRDFTFVKDVVGANILAAECDACGTFNVAQGDRITLNDLAELIAGITGNRSEIIHEKPRLGDIKHSLADISKYKAFGYEPKYSWEDGIRETVRSFQMRGAQ